MLTVAGGLAAAYLLALAAVFTLQRNYIYLPDDRRAALAATEVADLLIEIERQAADGLSSISWYRPPEAADRPLLVLLQGNAGHIGDRLFKIAVGRRNDSHVYSDRFGSTHAFELPLLQES